MPNSSAALAAPPSDAAAGAIAPQTEGESRGRPGLIAAGEHTLADQLYRVLSDGITASRLAPGSRLDESEVARQFGVSRTPVREALRQLGASGLVEPARAAACWSRRRHQCGCSRCSRSWPSWRRPAPAMRAYLTVVPEGSERYLAGSDRRRRT